MDGWITMAQITLGREQRTSSYIKQLKCNKVIKNKVTLEIHLNKTHLYLCVFRLLWFNTSELIHICLDEQFL